ncbi:hypothetical protein BH11ACT2_BH11ACT2_22160 [soil metagenome]
MAVAVILSAFPLFAPAANAVAWSCTAAVPSGSGGYTHPWGGVFGKTNGFCNNSGVIDPPHSGVDWDQVGTGQATYDLFAVHSGTIIDIDYDPTTFGNYVALKSSSDHRVIVYAHLSSWSVYFNQVVSTFQKIGVSGHTPTAVIPFIHTHLSGTSVWNGWYGGTNFFNIRTFLANNGTVWGTGE